MSEKRPLTLKKFAARLDRLARNYAQRQPTHGSWWIKAKEDAMAKAYKAGYLRGVANAMASQDEDYK